MKELFSLLLLVSESKSSVITSPEILYTAALERWLSGSVWGLLALNLLALTLFILSISSPQITKIKTFILTWQAEREKIRSERLAQKEAEQAAAAAAAAAATEATPQESAVESTQNVTPQVVDTGSTPPAPPSAEPIDSSKVAPETPVAKESHASAFTEAAAPELPPPPPPADTVSTSSVEPTAPASELEEKTEVLAEETTAIASQEQSAEPKTDEPPVAPQSLPETNLSGEKKEAGDAMTFESKQDFEKALNDFLSSPTEQTEEIPIFDTGSLDDSLRWTASEKSADKDKSKERLS